MVRGGSLAINKWGYEAQWPHYMGNGGYNPTYPKGGNITEGVAAPRAEYTSSLQVSEHLT